MTNTTKKTTKNATTKEATKKQVAKKEATKQEAKKQEKKVSTLATRCDAILKNIKLKNNVVLEDVNNAKNEASEMIENKKAFALCVATKDNKIATRILEVYIKSNNTCEVVAKKSTKEYFATNYKANYKENKKHLSLYVLDDATITKAINELVANC